MKPSATIIGGSMAGLFAANALLKKADIDVHELDAYLPSELGEILGVDCVVMGTFETSKPMSNDA